MTVLIVDDQIHVVSGLVCGIHWDEIGIKKVLKAYNVHEAKEQLKRFDVDIVLCDIEMPVENGLNLCAWSKKMGFHAEFIFLTAHADFLYAKEAIRLGGFDYVLQPARYEDVEQVIIKAKAHVTMQKRMFVMGQCNDMFQKQRDVLLDGICRSWLSGEVTDWEQIKRNLCNLGIMINDAANAWCSLVTISEKSSVMQEWEESLIAYALGNILQELLNPYACNCLCWQVKEGEYILLVYAEKEGYIVVESLNNLLKMLRQQFIEHYEQDFSCYVMQCEDLGKLSKAYGILDAMKSDNVEAINGVFWNSRRVVSALEKIQLSKIVTGWEKLLGNKLYDSFAADAKEQLLNLCQKRNMDAENLNRYYQEFMRVVYLYANAEGYTAQDIFRSRNDLKNACTAYTSVKKMEWLIEYVHAFFNECGASDEQRKTQIDSIFQYIRTHLDENIKRTEVAEAVHLNPNYVSRLFKNTVGISLKEYILQEKMKLAARFVKETDLPINVIAMKVGYANFSLFTQSYKKMCGGLTPVEDRRQRRKKKM